MSYAVLRSDKANDELFAIIQYITQDAGNMTSRFITWMRWKARSGSWLLHPTSGVIPGMAS